MAIYFYGSTTEIVIMILVLYWFGIILKSFLSPNPGYHIIY